MKSISEIVSDNLKRIREQKGLSLDAMARLTGVSKSMLAQIERMEVNPTITTVWKIANGLRVPFTQLVTKEESASETVLLSDIQPVLEDDGRYRNYPLFPYEEDRGFEIYSIELEPGAFLQAAAHPDGAQEYITVFQGEIEVTIDTKRLRADTGRALRFKADRPHAYHNIGREVCRLSMVISLRH